MGEHSTSSVQHSTFNRCRARARRCMLNVECWILNVRPMRSNAFTLLELMLVMTIIAIISATVIPTFRAFAIGRNSKNTASDIIGLANYARTQAAAEGRTYRLNFDPPSGVFWLTAQNAGVFAPPSNDFGNQYRVAEVVARRRE